MKTDLVQKPRGVKYGCCIAKLGFGYSYQMLMERINNKQNEFVGRKISAFIGFQVEIAVGIREKQYEVYRAPERNYPLYADLQRTVDVLNFVHNNHIHSLDDMEKVLKTANRMEDVAMNKYFKCEEKKQQLKVLNYLGDEYAYLLKPKTEMKRSRSGWRSFTGSLLQAAVSVVGILTKKAGWRN